MTDNEMFKDLPLDKIEMLSQPLTTEDGFLNPASVNELENYIRNMPRLRPDLRSDLEWTMRTWTCASDIVRHFSGWVTAGMLMPPDADGCYPPSLDSVVLVLRACIRRWERFEVFSGVCMGEVSLCELHDWLWETLEDLDAFNAWNDVDKVGPSWIDLCALVTNVCLSIEKDRRHDHAFNLKFEREYGEKPDDR